MTSSRRPEQLRLFVAVTLPPEVRAALAEVIGRLRAADVPGVRPVAPEAVHITLKFLGNVDASRVPDLAAALTAAGDGSAPFRIALQGVGGFPSLDAPRALWAGVSDDAGSLGGLARRVDEACASAGFPREQRPFSPHLTLARMRDTASPSDRRRAGAALADAGSTLDSAFAVDAFHLIKSTLTPSGPRYESLHVVQLQSA